MNLKTALQVILICSSISCLSCSNASDSPSFVPSHAPVIAGGYSTVKITKEVQRAAEFAVFTEAKNESTPIKLISVSKAEQQIVAGMNYHLLLAVTQKGTPRTSEVVVYRALDSNYKLTSWHWVSSQ